MARPRTFPATQRPLRRSHCCLAAAALWASGCSVPVASELAEGDAHEILLALDEAGIAASKVAAGQGRFEIATAPNDVAAALRVLSHMQLPHEPMPGFEELLGENRLVPSATAERVRYQVAVAGELAESLEAWPGVSRARVHLAFQQGHLRFGPRDEGSATGASVLLWTSSSSGPSDEAVAALCAGALTGLTPESVRVVRAPLSGETRRSEPFSQVGPLWVARGSVVTLKVIGSISLALHGILAATFIGFVVRNRRRPPGGPD